MKLQKCANGHFYDTEKYSSCPHCSGDFGDQMGDDSVTQSFSSGGPTVAANYDHTGYAPTVGFMDEKTNRETASGMIQGYPPYFDMDDGKTVGIRMKRSTEETRTQPLEPTQPVVGWLVCVEGSHYGQCFNLYAGKNFIGRSADMDVCLAKDSSVSRQKHAIVVFEPRTRKFFIQPGESHELVYVNDDVVLTSFGLSDRDVLTVGNTFLKFVPFCDERFGWNDK